MKDILILFKNSSMKVKIVTVYNIIAILVALSHSLSVLRLSILVLILTLFAGIFLLIFNYFLLKTKRIAFYLMLMWFAVQTFTFDFPDFKFGFFYGLILDLHIFGSPIGFNPVTIIMFLILLSAKRLFSEKIGGYDTSF